MFRRSATYEAGIIVAGGMGARIGERRKGKVEGGRRTMEGTKARKVKTGELGIAN